MPVASIRPSTVTGSAPTPPTVEIVLSGPTFVITSCGSLTRELFDELLPLAYKDAQLGDPLWKYCCAICGMLQDVDDLARDDGTWPGWAKLVDLNETPDEALDWLAQFVGVRPLQGISTAQKRARITSKEGFRRGSPQAMVSAAQNYLTGTKSVILLERDTSAYHLTVHTYTSETADSNAVELALISQKPAGLVMDYSTVPGQTWAQMLAGHATWTLVNSFYSNWGEVRDDLP